MFLLILLEKDDDEQSVDGTSNRMSNKNCVKRKLKESTINDGRNSSSSEYSECVVVRKVSYGLQSNPKNKNDYRVNYKNLSRDLYSESNISDFFLVN